MKIHKKQIIGFENESTFVEEGEFKGDELNGTFGRRIYMNGNYFYGYFLEKGNNLHGYGKDYNADSPSWY